VFTWYHNKDGEVEGQTVWTPFESDTDYFGDNDMMINYIVDDMDAIVERLRKEGVKFVDEVTGYEGLGKFVHIEDNEGRRVELWEPVK
jgi:predicted enzyme related to lactoylglutathione lyase